MEDTSSPPVWSGLVWIISSGSIMNIQFRVDRVYADISGTMDTWDELSKCHTAFAFEHPPTAKKTTHTHGYLFGTISAFKTFQGNVKKAFSLKANDYETSKTCGEGANKRPLDISGAWTYGSKFATIAPKYIKNISDTQVEELNDYARKLFTQIHGKQHSTASVSKITNKKPNVARDYYSIADSIRSNYAKILHERLDVPSKKENHRILYNCIIDKLHELRICIENRTTEKFMLTILTQDSHYREDLFSELYSRIYRNT